jgi:hypothetical protein
MLVLNLRHTGDCTMYSLYYDARCSEMDEQIADAVHTDKHQAKLMIKRIMRRHTPRLCKKRYARLRHSYDLNDCPF